MEKSEYIAKLAEAVFKMHGAKAAHAASVPVHEVFRGQTVWRGIVEVYDLTGHPKAKRCYAWAHADGPGNFEDRFVAVLELPPVNSPETAVRVAIVAEMKRKQAN